MAVNKVERFEAETKTHALLHEAGVQAVRALLILRQTEVNATWSDASGDDLIKLQGEAKLIRKLLDTIEHGPVIKSI